MRILFALACFFAFTSAGQAAAQEAAWRLSAYEGLVRVTQPGQAPSEASVGQSLRIGTTITTGANSRATLENGAQRIVVAANSRMTIAPESRSGMTRFLQDLGSALFQVDRQEAPHFTVETPLLAAVVKGTTFTVTAGPQQDLVHVAHGLVEVRSNASGAVIDVPAGDTARVSREAPGAVARLAPGELSPGDQALSTPGFDYAAVSDGLLEGPSRGSVISAGGGANGNGVGSAAAGGANQHAALVHGASTHANNGNGPGANNGNGNAPDNNNGNGNGPGNNNGNGPGGDNGNGPEMPPPPPRRPDGRP